MSVDASKHFHAGEDEPDPRLELVTVVVPDDPDVLWNVEVFRSVEAKDAYENGPLADELRDEILDLLAEAPMRVEAHPYAAIPALPGDAE